MWSQQRIVITLGIGMFAVLIMTSGSAELPIEGKVPFWEQDLDGEVSTMCIDHDGSTIIASTEDGQLYKFSNENQKASWKRNFDRPIGVQLSKDGEFLAVKHGMNVSYIDPVYKDSLWTVELDQDLNRIHISDHGERVLALGVNRSYLLDGANGDLLEEQFFDITKFQYLKGDLSENGSRYVVAHGGESYSFGGDIYFFDTKNSSLNWENTFGGGFRGVELSDDRQVVMVYCGYYTTMWDQGYTGSMYLFNRNGNLTYSKDVDAVGTADMSDDGSVIILSGYSPRKLYCMNNHSEDPEWSDSYERELVFTKMSGSGDICVVGSESGFFDVYTSNGSSLWSRQLSTPLSGFQFGGIGNVEISGNCRRLVCTPRESKTIALFNLDAPPYANAGEDKKIETGKKLTFEGTVSSTGTPIVKVQWDFDGDGTYDQVLDSNGPVKHTYKKEGTYEVRFMVTNVDGSSCIDTLEVKVEEASSGTPGFEAPLVLLALLSMCIIERRLRSK